MDTNRTKQKNLVAQWAFDCRPILGRLHLWLEDVRIEWLRGQPADDLLDSISFTDQRTEKMLAMTLAVTALGTRLFGRYGQGAGLEKKLLNIIKKDADAISAYAMSESLWYLSRTLPENHAIMVCLGEGLMPKVGETSEMGANPLLGFGRIYARPEVAKFLETCVHRLINDPAYTWEDFRQTISRRRITIWGAAIDTLENTSRFARGEKTGPLTVLHLFDRPLAISDQYEGYIGNLVLPQKVVDQAAEDSILIDFFTPRHLVVRAIQKAYPGIQPGNIHVWSLRGKSRAGRIGHIWEQWESAGAHLVDENWTLPTGWMPFTDSGTYAPTLAVGEWKDPQNTPHLLIVDGYAASAEAIQAASLAPILDLSASLAVLSSRFQFAVHLDAAAMKLDPDNDHFAARLQDLVKDPDLDPDTTQVYQDSIRAAKKAGIPLKPRTITADDLISEKHWQALAGAGYMLPDPYTGAPGVTQIADDTYEVTVRITTARGDKRITFALRLLEDLNQSKLVFSPLLNRFLKGENFQQRAVKISDSGRIRNELQTLFSEALSYLGTKVLLTFEKIPEATISREDQKMLRQILTWYKENHPIWFDWLDLE
jgi:hypothetical protein